jgi:hypothetical protein
MAGLAVWHIAGFAADNNGWTDLGGWLLSNSGYSIQHLARGPLHRLVLRRDRKGAWEPVAVLNTPALSEDSRIGTNFECSLRDGTGDVVAIAREGRGTDVVVHAWRIDVRKKHFEALDPARVRCKLDRGDG